MYENPCKSWGKHEQAMDFIILYHQNLFPICGTEIVFFVFNFLILIIACVSLFWAIIILNEIYMSVTEFIPKGSILDLLSWCKY